MEGNRGKIVLAVVVIVAIAAVAITFILTTGRSRDSLPDDARLILSVDDIGLINQELATNGSVSIPTNVALAPQGCPESDNDHCIWICTGDGPLDSIDDETCSTHVWICSNCDGNPDVCETGEGERVPCPGEPIGEYQFFEEIEIYGQETANVFLEVDPAGQ